MAGPPLNFPTLACADVERMAAFLRPLGRTGDAESEAAHRLCQGTNGIVVALYAAKNYERDSPHTWKRGSTVTPDGDLTWS